MSSLTELFEFLHSPNPDAREVALTNLIGHTPKTQPGRSIFIPSASSTPIHVQKQGPQSGVPVKQNSAEDAVKLEMLEDLKTLCRDVTVSVCFLLPKGH